MQLVTLITLQDLPHIAPDLPESSIILSFVAVEFTLDINALALLALLHAPVSLWSPDFDSVPLCGLLPLALRVCISLIRRDGELGKP